MPPLANPVVRSAVSVALAGAWFFALGTLAGLIYFASQGWPGNGRTTVYATTVDGAQINAVGLTWAGTAGTALLWTELTLVAMAIVASAMPVTAIRRAGLAALLAWSALWLANGIWITSYGAPWSMWVCAVGLVGLFFLCTLIRTIRGWQAAAPQPRPLLSQ